MKQIDYLANAETLRQELFMLRRKISRMTNKSEFDEIDVLLSVAETQIRNIILALQRVRP